MSYIFAFLVLYLYTLISKIHVHLFTCVIHITYPHQTHVYKCSYVWQYTILIFSLIFTGICTIYCNLTLQCTWNIMFKIWCKHTHDRTTMLPEIHNASIFYGTQSVTPDTSTSHMRLAEYSQTKEIHSPHLKHPPWFTGCSKKSNLQNLLEPRCTRKKTISRHPLLLAISTGLGRTCLWKLVVSYY